MLGKLVEVEKQEIPALIVSFLYFFCLLCGYYILRPVRDEMGIQGGVENLQWLFTGTFIAMLIAVPVFGAAVSRFQRSRLIPVVYYFFIANLLFFFFIFKSDISVVWTARAFFIWLSVFNLFVVSVFWSLMADLFSNEQSKRLFGFIAAGGSAGAILGPSITAFMSTTLGPVNLLPVSAVFLFGAVACVHLLLRWKPCENNIGTLNPDPDRTPIGGSIFAGFTGVLKSRYLQGICLFIVLYTTLATFLYFMQARIIEGAFDDPGRRTSVFAYMDLAVNVLTVFGQVYLTGRLATRMGMAVTLALIPLLLAGGFVLLGLFPVLSVLIAVQVLRRAGNFAVTRPGREMLFTVIPREDKYKAKNFIDTAVYRGGDAASGWAYAGLAGIGMTASNIAFIAVPIAAIWMMTGYLLGKRQDELPEGMEIKNKIKDREYENIINIKNNF